MPKKNGGKKVIKKRFVVKKIVRASSAKKRTPGLPRVVEMPTVATAALPASKALLTLEDRHLLAMLSDPRYTGAIPCVMRSQSELKKVGKRCGRCNKKRARMRSSVLRDMRACLARMDSAQQQVFKTLAGARNIQIAVAVDRTVKTITF